MITINEDLHAGKKDSAGKAIIYAKKGDKVKLISDRDEALIVQSSNGNKFSVAKIKTDYANK